MIDLENKKYGCRDESLKIVTDILKQCIDDNCYIALVDDGHSINEVIWDCSGTAVSGKYKFDLIEVWEPEVDKVYSFTDFEEHRGNPNKGTVQTFKESINGEFYSATLGPWKYCDPIDPNYIGK